MKPYAKEYALTNSILQEVWNIAKWQLFASADDNVCHTMGGANRLCKLDHEVELIFGD